MATTVLGYGASPGAERALETALEIGPHFGDCRADHIRGSRPRPPRRIGLPR